MTRRQGIGVELVSIDNLADILNAYEVTLMLLAESAGCLTQFRENVNREISERRGSASEVPNLFVLKRLSKRMRAKSARFDRHPGDSIDANVSDLARALLLRLG